MKEEDLKQLWRHSVRPEDIRIDREELQRALTRRLRTLRYSMSEREYGGMPAVFLLTGLMIWIHLARAEHLNWAILLGEGLVVVALGGYLRRFRRVLRQGKLPVDINQREYLQSARQKLSEQLAFFEKEAVRLVAIGSAGLLLIAWGGYPAIWGAEFLSAALLGMAGGAAVSLGRRREHLRELRQGLEELTSLLEEAPR